MRFTMSASKAIQIIGGLKVPSETVTSIEVAEALIMGIKALEKQIDIGQALTDWKDNYNPENRYTDNTVIEVLEDVYMLSEVNNE